MAYSDFSLTEVSEKLALSLVNHRLFENLLPIQPSSWLSETLNLSLDFALKSGSEKARFVSIDSDRYYINEIDKIIGCLQAILSLYLNLLGYSYTLRSHL